jgi:uncharacterized protein YhbP (UPF0306 family)
MATSSGSDAARPSDHRSPDALIDWWAVVPRLLASNRYLVLGTADETGQPWVTPVFFAARDHARLYWVSSPQSRHSRNIEARPEVAITVFDSTVAVGEAEAVYLVADAAAVRGAEWREALRVLNSQLPSNKRLVEDDLAPDGSLTVYRGDPNAYYVLVRGGDPDGGNEVDARLEVVPPTSLN